MDKETTLNNLETAIEGIQISKFLNYNVLPDGSVTDSEGNPVSAIESFLAQKTIANLKDGLTITLQDVFTAEQLNQGVFTLLDDKGIAIDQIAVSLKTSLEDATLGKLVTAGIITGTSAQNISTKKIKTTDHPEGIALSSLKLADFLDVILNNSALNGLIFVNN